MATAERVSIGFSGGGVVEVKISAEKVKDLRSALEKPNGFADLDTEEGLVSINLAEVIFVRSTASTQSIGFSG
jgi:hypothetical protein